MFERDGDLDDITLHRTKPPLNNRWERPALSRQRKRMYCWLFVKFGFVGPKVMLNGKLQGGYTGTRGTFGGRTELTECRVLVWRSFRSYRSAGYRIVR